MSGVRVPDPPPITAVIHRLMRTFAAAVLIASFAVLFPALSHSQFQARIAGCQNHLRQVGMALHDAANMQPDRRFPEIPDEGNLAVAGSYGPRLVGQGLVSDPAAFFCPGASTDDSIPPTPGYPSLEEINAATGARVAELQRIMGGHYAFPLGYVENGKIVPVRDERRSNFPLLADAPCDAQPGRASRNHLGRGQNVFFEDGHIELYNLADDPGERHDRAKEMPERTKQLQAQLADWRKSIKASMPKQNDDRTAPIKNRRERKKRNQERADATDD